MRRQAWRGRAARTGLLLVLFPVLGACGTTSLPPPGGASEGIPAPFENYDSSRPASFKPPPLPGSKEASSSPAPAPKPPLKRD